MFVRHGILIRSLTGAAVICALVSAAAQVPQPTPAVTACMAHLTGEVTAEARKAAMTDCTFAADSQIGGADAWSGNAADDVSTTRLQGRDKLHTAMAKTYAQPGFKLEWFPTSATQSGSLVVTAGEFRRTAMSKEGKLETTTGHYVTVWKRQEDGTYRFVWDGGE